MKKLIAISVVFALIAGAAFAADVSGEVFGKITPLQGDTAKAPAGQKGSGVQSSGEMKRIRVEASGEDDNGTFGGYIRIDKHPWWTSDWNADLAVAGSEAAILTGNVWWKPSEQFKFLIGGNGKDGFFGADGITRWGFYQVAADGIGIAQENWRFSRSFYQGFDPLYSAIFTITPTEAVEVNIGIPFFSLSGTEAGTVNKDGQKDQMADKFKKTNFQFAYTIDGTGKFALTYKGDVMEGNDQPKVFGYFNLTAIENLGVDIGIGFKFPGKDPSISNPISAGVGVAYNAGEFGVKARVQGTFGGEKSDPLAIDFDVLPYYAISDTLTFFFDAGIYLAMPHQGDNAMGWHINPYITVKSSWWAPNFYAGLRIENKYNPGSPDSDVSKPKGDDDVIKWSVPIGIVVHF